MLIPVKLVSNSTGNIKRGAYTARDLLRLIDESDLIADLTKCNCEPVGETNVTECNREEEWIDCDVLIGDEI